MLALIAIVAIVLVFFQFRGDFLKRTQLTMMSARSGLSMDPGAKVTYNGVEIGRVADVRGGQRRRGTQGQDHRSTSIPSTSI